MSTRNFDSLASLAAHLGAAAGALSITEHRALNRAAKVIEKEAKAEFGHYQPEVGQFPAWAELADSTKTDRVRKGFTENDPLLRTGGLRDSISHETHGLEAVIGSKDEVMLFQELGTNKIPPRPVLGPAGVKSDAKVKRILGGAVLHALEHGASGPRSEDGAG